VLVGLSDYKDVFSKANIDKLPLYTKYDYKLKLLPNLESKLRTSPLYSVLVEQLDTIKTYILRYIAIGFIKTCNVLFALLVLYTKKLDRGFRFYINYRKLNALTKKDRYPIPLISKTLNRLSRAKIFTKLDIR